MQAAGEPPVVLGDDRADRPDRPDEPDQPDHPEEAVRPDREVDRAPRTRHITALIGLDAGVRAGLAFLVGIVVARYLGPASHGILALAIAVVTSPAGPSNPPDAAERRPH